MLYRTANTDHYACLKQRALAMRKDSTPAEAAMWEMVRGRKLGCRFLRQYIIADYIVDFVCLEKRIILEIDGEYHLEDNQKEWDIEREHWLNRRGYCIIRFTNQQVLCSPDSVIKEINEYL